GRDAHVERAGLGDTAGTAALRALLVDDRTDALALAARLGERERALVRSDQTRAVADRTRPRLGARLGPGAVAGVADARGPQRDRQRRPVHRVGEVERHLGFDVTPPLRSAPGAGPAPAAEDGAEEVGEPGAAKALIAGLSAGSLRTQEVVQ